MNTIGLLKNLHLFSALLGLLFAIALRFRYKMQYKLNRYFLALLSVFSIGLLLKAVFSVELYSESPKIWFIIIILAYSPGLLWYYLALDLKGETKKLNFDHVIGLLPILYRLGIMVWILPKSNNEILQMRQYDWYEMFFFITCATIAFSNIWFFWVTWRRGYLKINKHFSKMFVRFTQIMKMTMVFWCALLVLALISSSYQNTFVYFMIEISFLIISLTIVFFAFSYIVKPEQYKFLWIYYETNEYKTLNDIFSKVEAEMKLRETYRDSGLSLSMLSKLIDTHPKKITKCIKYFTQQNFSEYINAYRIHYFIESIKKGKLNHYDIWGLAQESGFGNKMSFYESFKKITDLTPKEFIDKKKYLIQKPDTEKQIEKRWYDVLLSLIKGKSIKV